MKGPRFSPRQEVKYIPNDLSRAPGRYVVLGFFRGMYQIAPKEDCNNGHPGMFARIRNANAESLKPV